MRRRYLQAIVPMTARGGDGRQQRIAAILTALLLAVRSPGMAGSPPATASTIGARLFAAECAHCHGATAAGDGADAALFVHPPPALDRAAAADPEVLVRRILDGGSAPLAIDPAALRRRAERGEALVSHLRRMARVDWPLVERGRSLYVAGCADCHGPFGGSAPARDAPRPRALGDPAFQAAVSDRELQTMVRHGGPRMPPLPEPIDDGAARALVAYVRLLSPGYETYERFCAGCHGEEGHGGRSPSGRAAPEFDRAFLSAHDGASLRAGVWHMLDDERPTMPHFRGVLDDAAARAIVAFLRDEIPPR
jgi:mono/diheme cytochrome c family protein